MNHIKEIKVDYEHPQLQRLSSAARPKFFLHPRILMAWVGCVAELGSSVLLVGLVLQWRSLCCKSDSVTLPNSILQTFGLSRDAKARGLRALEKAGLIQVDRSSGKSSRIRILPLSIDDN